MQDFSLRGALTATGSLNLFVIKSLGTEILQRGQGEERKCYV